jgi:hypothetical protein
MTAGEIVALILNGLVAAWMLFWTVWMVGAAVRRLFRR